MDRLDDLHTETAQRRIATAAIFGLSLLMGADGADASESATLDALLPKLGAWSTSFEAMMHRSTYSLTGHIDGIDGDGAVTDRKNVVLRISGYRKNQRVEVVRYLDNGEDQTEKLRKQVADDERKAKSDPPSPEDELRLPFLPSEQEAYSFRIVQVDVAIATRVRVYFSPKRPARNRIVGSAWVDGNTGEVLSIGASPSKLPAFVDAVRVTIELGAHTPLGRGVSRVRFEGQSSFLMFKKRFRGEATLSGYHLT